MEATGAKGSSSTLAPPAPPAPAPPAASQTPVGSKTALATQKSATQVAASPTTPVASSPVQGILIRGPSPAVDENADQKSPVSPAPTAATSGRLRVSVAAAATRESAVPAVPELNLAEGETERSARCT